MEVQLGPGKFIDQCTNSFRIGCWSQCLPPWSHKASGAIFGLFQCLIEPEPHAHIISNAHIATVLIDTRRGLTDPTVRDKFHLARAVAVKLILQYYMYQADTCIAIAYSSQAFGLSTIGLARTCSFPDVPWICLHLSSTKTLFPMAPNSHTPSTLPASRYLWAALLSLGIERKHGEAVLRRAARNLCHAGWTAKTACKQER